MLQLSLSSCCCCCCCKCITFVIVFDHVLIVAVTDAVTVVVIVFEDLLLIGSHCFLDTVEYRTVCVPSLHMPGESHQSLAAAVDIVDVYPRMPQLVAVPTTCCVCCFSSAYFPQSLRVKHNYSLHPRHSSLKRELRVLQSILEILLSLYPSRQGKFCM